MPRKRSEGLSPKQAEILAYIKDYILTRHYPPSVRDICGAVGLKSTSSVHAHLNALERFGYIRRDPSLPRCLEILDPDFKSMEKEVVILPLLGTVAAGQPILAEQNIMDHVPVPAVR